MEKKNTILGIILAGGRGSRMGGTNKAELMLVDQRLVDLAIIRLSSQVDQVIFNAPSPLDMNIPTVPDIDGNIKGPLAGLLAAFQWGRENLDGPFAVQTVAVDTPFFPTDLVARLSGQGGPAIAKTLGEAQTTFGFWPDITEADLRKYIGNSENPSIRGFAKQQDIRLVGFQNPDQFFNINTPKDLTKAEDLAKRLL